LPSLAFVGAFCRSSSSCSIWFRSSLIQRCSSSTPFVVTLSFHAPDTLAVSSYLLRRLKILSVTFIGSHFSKSEATNSFPYHSSALLLALCEYFPCQQNTTLLACIRLLAGHFLSSCVGLPTATSLPFLLHNRQFNVVVQILPSARCARPRPTLRKSRFRHPLWAGSI
jgi:hypothetical protein